MYRNTPLSAVVKLVRALKASPEGKALPNATGRTGLRRDENSNLLSSGTNRCSRHGRLFEVCFMRSAQEGFHPVEYGDDWQ